MYMVLGGEEQFILEHVYLTITILPSYFSRFQTYFMLISNFLSGDWTLFKCY